MAKRKTSGTRTAAKRARPARTGSRSRKGAARPRAGATRTATKKGSAKKGPAAKGSPKGAAARKKTKAATRATRRRKTATRAANTRTRRRTAPSASRLAKAAATARGALAGAVAAIADRLPWTDDRPDAITFLEDDHQRLRTMLDAGRQTTMRAVKTRADVLTQLASALTIHELIEEKLLYPVLRQYPEATDHVLEGIQEHHVADVVLGELQHLAPDDRQWGAKFKVLQENIEHHLDEEERELFRTARGLLDRDALAALGEQMAAMKRDAEPRG